MYTWTSLTLKILIDFVFPYDDISCQSLCTYIRLYFHFTLILLFIDIYFVNIWINNGIFNNFEKLWLFLTMAFYYDGVITIAFITMAFSEYNPKSKSDARVSESIKK